MDPKLKPRFDERRFLFFREEHAGYASAISPGDPNKALHVLNPTVVDVARLCTGEATVQEIQVQYATRYGQGPDSPLAQYQSSPGPLDRYVEEAIILLSLYNLVTFEVDEELPAADEELPAADESKPVVRRLEEWDLAALRTLMLGGTFPEKEDVPTIHYRHPYLPPAAYGELMLRMRIFQNQEFFYAVATGSRLEFVVSCFDERPLKPVTAIATILGTDRYTLGDGLAEVLPVLIDDVKASFDKIQWRQVTGPEGHPELADLLESYGFGKEGVLVDEFGPGRDEEIFTRHLRPPPADDTPQDPEADGPSL